MKRTLIFAVLMLLFSAVFFIADDAFTYDTACPVGCVSTVILSVDCSNCSGIYCGTGMSTTSFVTNDRGQFILNCRCAGTYYFCLGGSTYSATVDGSGGVTYATLGGLCPCPDN